MRGSSYGKSSLVFLQFKSSFIRPKLRIASAILGESRSNLTNLKCFTDLRVAILLLSLGVLGRPFLNEAIMSLIK
jgi:hypothetical protein